MYIADIKAGSLRKLGLSDTVAVDYMLARIDDTELYAEREAVDNDEDGNYDDLKVEIMTQAKDAGINVNELEF